jgi:hypothetical protein
MTTVGEKSMIGIGKVFKGREFIADVQYEYRTTNQYDKGVLTSQTAYLHIQPATAISPYFSNAEMLTLHMSDGKKQNFFVEYPSQGECRGTGDPY